MAALDPSEELVDQMKSLGLNPNTKLDILVRDRIKIPKWLENCQCPFLWHSRVRRGDSAELMLQRTLEKIEELKLEEKQFTMQGFVLHLKLVLEYYIVDNMEKAWEMMTFVEKLLDEETADGIFQTEYKNVKVAFGHVMSSSKANLLALDGDNEKSEKIGRNIIPMDVMDASNLATLYAMKCRFFLYAGYENGEDVGVKSARKANELQPENAEWAYLLAKILRQQRKDVPFSMDIPREELMLLEKSCASMRKPKYLVYLAQVYRECGAQAFKQYRNQQNFYKSELCQSINEMNQKALNLYKEVLEQEATRLEPSTLRRIGYGIMNLPKRFADYPLALKCLEDSLALTHCPITLHMLGTFYHRYGNDNKKAIEYFEKTRRSHAGLSDLIRVQYMEDPEGYDPVEDLKSGLGVEMKQHNRSLFLVQLGAWYWLTKGDFIKSIEYFTQVLDEEINSLRMTNFKSFFLRMFDPIDLYHYLANESLLYLEKCEQTKNRTDLDDKDTKMLENLASVKKLMEKLTDFRPELAQIIVDPNLVKELLKKSEEIMRGGRDDQRRPYGDRGRQNHRGQGYGGRRDRPGGRGGFSSNRSDGPGFSDDRFERKGFSGDRPERREFSEDRPERRGRFSTTNQRENTRKEDDKESGRENYNWRRGQRGRENHSRYESDKTNWRGE